MNIRNNKVKTKTMIIVTVFILISCIILNNVTFVNAEKNVNANNNVFSKSTTPNNEYLPVNYTYEWPMYGHDLNNTGYIDSGAPDTNDVLWTFQTGGEIISSPVAVDGRVFIGSKDGNMYCLDATNGGLIWKFTGSGQITKTPSVVAGKVYFGCYKSHDFYCLDENTGNLIWNISFPTPYDSGPASAPTVHNGKVFVGVYDANLYALDADNGSILWNFTTEHVNVVSNPAVVNGKVIFGSFDKSVYCLNEKNGSLIWRTMTDSLMCTPTVLHNKVYVGDMDEKVYCLNVSDGKEIWNYTGPCHEVISRLAVDTHNDKLFFGTTTAAYSDNVFCINASTGEYIWSVETLTGYVSAGAPIIADSKVYVGSSAYGYVYCYNASNGDLIWSYCPHGGVWATGGLAIAYNKLYVGMYDYKVYCFGLPTDKPTAFIDDISTNFTVEGKNISFTGHGNDTDGEIIKYCWSSNIDGFLSAKPSFITNKLSVGNHTITFKVLDSGGEWSDEKTVNVTIRSNNKPLIEDIDELVAIEDEPFEFYVSASDPDNDNITFYDDSNLFDINSTTGLILFTPTNDDVGTYNITIKVIDEWDAESSVNFTLIVENVNDKPVIDWWSPPIGEIEINETENITFSITASDIDVGDVLSYKWYLNDVLVSGEHNNSYLFMSDYESSGIYNITVVVIDDGTPPLSDTHTWFLTVLNKNRKPVLEPIKNQTAYEGLLFELQTNATDPDNDILTFADNSSLFDINSTTGLISFTPNYDSAGDYLINITITDGKDFAGQTFKLTIINMNRPPTATISSPLDNAKFTTKDNIFFDANGSSDPDNDNLTYSWESSMDGNIGNTASFSRKLSKGMHTITLEIDDGNGGMDIKQITITVNNPTSSSKPFIPMLEIWIILLVIGVVVVLHWCKKR